MPLRRKPTVLGTRPTPANRPSRPERRIIEGFLNLINAWKNSFRGQDLGAFLDSIENNIGATPLNRFQVLLGNVSTEVEARAGQQTAKDFDAWADRQFRQTPVRMSAHFDGYDPRVVTQLRNHAALTVIGISSNTRDAITRAMETSWTQGVTTAETAKIIKPMIGLTPRDAQAVTNLYNARIRAGDPAAVARKVADAAAERHLVRRAKTIARTELHTAANIGRRAAWEQAINDGYIDANELVQQWHTGADERLCKICAPMNLQTRAIGMDFTSPTNSVNYPGPPAHPNCRCAVGLVRATDVAKSFTENELVTISKFNPYHGSDGRFTSGPGGGLLVADMSRSASNLEQEELEAQAAAIFEGEIKTANGEVIRAEVDSVYDWGDSEISVEGTLYYQDGGQAGSFTRTLRPNDGVVVNEFFEVNSELQGRGAGTKMMAEWEDSYARSGFHTMEVNASSGGNFNGAYVWARYGYTPSPGETARVAQKFLNSSQGSIDPPFMSGSDYVAKFGDSLLPGITSIRGFDKFLMTEDVAWNGTKSTNTLSKSIADAVKVINRWMRDNPAALEKDDVGFWKEVRDALKVTITKEDKASHGGAMISVPIPESLSQQIAVEGGTEPGDHHITLAFLTNDASTLSEEDRKNIESVMEAIGMLFGPSFGFLQQDYGTFEPGPNSEGMIPWWRKPVVRNLSEIRRVLVAGLEKHGIECSKNFRWTPHVTIDYLPEGQRPEEPRFTRRREYFNVDRIRFTADREAVDVSLHGAIR